MIGGLIKYFRFSWDDILWKYSWQNLTMLMLSIPKYESNDKKDDHEITDISQIQDLIT